MVSKAGFDDVGMDLLEVFHVGALGLEHGEAICVAEKVNLCILNRVSM